MKQKKSHFGKPPLAEYALRRPPCQSELEEAYESTNKTKAFRRTGSHSVSFPMIPFYVEVLQEPFNIAPFRVHVDAVFEFSYLFAF